MFSNFEQNLKNKNDWRFEKSIMNPNYIITDSLWDVPGDDIDLTNKNKIK